MAEVDAGAVAPVVPVVPASPDAPGIVSTAETIEEAPEGEPKPEAPQRIKFDDLQQKEVDRIVAKRVAQESRRLERVARAEARADVAERQLREHRPQQQQPPQDGEPKQTDFTDYEEYLLAKAEWRIEQKQAKKQETQQRDHATQQSQNEEAEMARHVQQNVYTKGVEKYDDFDDVAMREQVLISRPMTAFIADSPVGHDIWYDLGKHPEEAKRIFGLSPAGQFRELVKLETKLSAPPKPTQTPAPIVPGRANSASTKSMLDMNQDEFEKHRKARLARK